MARPAAAKRMKGSSLRIALSNSADDDERKQGSENEAKRDAEFLARHRENEVGMAVGQDAT